MRQIALAIAAATLTACSGPTLHIESTTSWSGYIGGDAGATFEGTGSRQIELNRGRTCWSIQKQTEQGTLRAYAKGGGIFGPGRSGDASTSAAYGVVSGCTD